MASNGKIHTEKSSNGWEAWIDGIDSCGWGLSRQEAISNLMDIEHNRQARLFDHYIEEAFLA